MPGPVHPAEPYYSAFDVFLNTSIYEGLSIAMLEAKARGCPVVCADVGGASEALEPTDSLIEDAADIDAYVTAILQASERGQRDLPPLAADPDLTPRLWALLGAYGAPTPADAPNGAATTLVITENLNMGGPQRSLTNLISHWPKDRSIAVAVLEPLYWPDFHRTISEAGRLVFGLEDPLSMMERCERVLQLIERTGATTLVFWNAPAPLKLALAKVLELRKVRIVDVSPGPMLQEELLAAGDYARRLSLSVDEYFARVDCFVSKYLDGAPAALASAHPERIHVIPNGVPLPAAIALPRAQTLAIGTCCRIVPSKRLELLVDVMDVLAERLPEATLTIVGAADPWHGDYAAQIADKIARAGLRNIRFVDARAEVTPLLQSFDVFVMLSDDQGCPNASLEAMAAGLPVVANDTGGVAEQVIDGVTGVLVADDDPVEIANALEMLLRDPEKCAAFGAAARRHVERTFSMQRMVDGYGEAFGYPSASARTQARTVEPAR